MHDVQTGGGRFFVDFFADGFAELHVPNGEDDMRSPFGEHPRTLFPNPGCGSCNQNSPKL